MTYEETIKKLNEDCPPISLEKLKAVKKIIVHGGRCPDGKASAMILKSVYGGRTPIEFVAHGSKDHKELKPEPGLLFCDFCVPESNWKEFLDAGAIVLDHHKGVKDICLAFVKAGQGVFADEKDHPGVSGATLAYEYVMKAYGPEFDDPEGYELGRIAGIRDTWQKDHPEWEVSCKQAEALSFWPNEKLLDHSASWEDLLSLGDILWARKLATAKKVAGRSFRFTSKAGTRVAVFQGLRMSSDVAEYLEEEVDLVIGYDLMLNEAGSFNMGFSTRSHTTYHCADFAKIHGGGGHTRAAGFSVPISNSGPNPYRAAQIIVNAYEGNLWAKIVKRLFL